MTIQRQTTQFRRGATAPYNCVDVQLLATAYQSARSRGATIIDYAPVVPVGDQSFALQSVGFTAQLFMALNGNLSGPFGRLGKVIAGILSPGSTQAETSGGYETFNQTVLQVPSQQPMLPLPDPTLSFTLWDPAVDELPPAGTPDAGTAGLPITGSLQLPNPVKLYGGQQIAVGMWITPSLVGISANTGAAGNPGWELSVGDASYTLTYDDGL